MNTSNTQTTPAVRLDNRYNPTTLSTFARVIPAPAYTSHKRSFSKRDLHRAEVAARKAGVR